MLRAASESSKPPRERRRAKATKGNHGIPFSDRGQPLSTETNQRTKVLCWILSILKQTVSRIENGEFLHLLSGILGCLLRCGFRFQWDLLHHAVTVAIAAAIAQSWLAITKVK